MAIDGAGDRGRNPAEASAGVLQRLFGLGPEDIAVLQSLFDALGGRAFGGLAQALDAGTPPAAALGLSPQLIENLYARAFALFDAGHVDRSEALFRTLCTLDGKRADHWMGLGICARVREDFSSAMVAFSTASSLREDWAVPLFHLLEAHMRRGEFEAAAALLPRVEAGIEQLTPPIQDETARFKLALQVRRRG